MIVSAFSRSVLPVGRRGGRKGSIGAANDRGGTTLNCKLLPFRTHTAAGILAALFVVPATASESDLSGVVTLASEYIYRGQAVSDHNPALSAGLDYQHSSGFFGGIWVSTIDLQSRSGRRDAELDYYLGYQFETHGPLAVTATLIHYSYPGDTGTFDYEHNELLLAATYNNRYTLEFGYTDDVYGFGRPARHWGVRGEWPAASYGVLSAGVGSSDLTSVDTGRYLYWDAGVSFRWSRLTADLRWHDNEAIDGPFRYRSAGGRLVASVSLGF